MFYHSTIHYKLLTKTNTERTNLLQPPTMGHLCVRLAKSTWSTMRLLIASSSPFPGQYHIYMPHILSQFYYILSVCRVRSVLLQHSFWNVDYMHIKARDRQRWYCTCIYTLSYMPESGEWLPARNEQTTQQTALPATTTFASLKFDFNNIVGDAVMNFSLFSHHRV